jgi:hypothetical protein
MYALMHRLLPPVLANAATILWYATLLVAIYALWGAPQAEFRYIEL